MQRALNRVGAHIPVVIITANDSPDVREACIREGTVAHLCKPLDERLLLDAIRLALDSLASVGPLGNSTR